MQGASPGAPRTSQARRGPRTGAMPGRRTGADETARCLTSLTRMAAKRAERLVNLVIALLSTRQYVTAARIRTTVPGYEADDGSDRADEAFKRMFERDKAELREMGVPLETGRTSAFDTEDGYRIARADYELPEISLTGDEAAAVGLAFAALGVRPALRRRATARWSS